MPRKGHTTDDDDDPSTDEDIKTAFTFWSLQFRQQRPTVRLRLILLLKLMEQNRGVWWLGGWQFMREHLHI